MGIAQLYKNRITKISYIYHDSLIIFVCFPVLDPIRDLEALQFSYDGAGAPGIPIQPPHVPGLKRGLLGYRPPKQTS